MPSQKVEFPNASGHLLSGIMDHLGRPPVAYALFAHCFTCSKNLKAASNISAALNASGIAVLRFDFTGLGQSEGDFSDTNFSSNVDDLLTASAFLEERFEAPAILVGHSLGGTAVLQAARRIESAVAVATIGSPSEAVHVAHLLEGSRDELRERGEATVNLGGRPFRMKQQFVDDLESHAIEPALGSLRKALLIMHAPLDTVVEVDNASALFVAAKHPKSFVSLDDADHLLSREEDSLYAGKVLAAWASRYLPERDDVSAADDSQVAATTRSGGFRTDITLPNAQLIADEPASVGGTGLGPTPYDLLSAALASCTTMTLQMYARHKKLDLRAATVMIEHDKIHAKDCMDCERSDGKIDEFRRTITLEGDLTEEQRQRMLEIADRCPVHRTLHSEVKVRSSLA
ncbi:MAG: bifunctional alpha/beta hydrolase/OsmC family protein [Woeseiaceae bacterium]|nr:bifunctional alpha/beta hydrolase/OsmC family protein [Woeseiaceae bacterium]